MENTVSTLPYFFLQSVQFSHSVMSTLQPHGLQHARLPCPSQTPKDCSNSCQLSQWYHPTISSLSSPSLSALNLSQHQGPFQWVSSVHQVAKGLELQHESFQWIFRTDFLGLTGWISLHSKGLLRVFSKTTVQIINSLVLSFLYSPTLTAILDCWENHSFD